MRLRFALAVAGVMIPGIAAAQYYPMNPPSMMAPQVGPTMMNSMPLSGGTTSYNGMVNGQPVSGMTMPLGGGMTTTTMNGMGGEGIRARHEGRCALQRPSRRTRVRLRWSRCGSDGRPSSEWPAEPRDEPIG